MTAKPHVRDVSRRQILAAGIGLTGTLVTAGATRRAVGAAQSTPEPDGHAHSDPPLTEAAPSWLLWEPADLSEPEARMSVDGELRTELRVAYTYHDIGGYRLNMRSYEGSIPGPTLRVQPGDTLNISLINDLPPNSDPLPVDVKLPHRSVPDTRRPRSLPG